MATQAKPMTKKRAMEIIFENAQINARKWLEQVIANGEVYYLVESVSSTGMFRKITLAVVDPKGYNDVPRLDFFWPNPDGAHPETDEAIKTLGGYHEAVSNAAVAVGFSLKRRCFAMSGCGMDMVFATMYDLAHKAGRTIADEEARKKFINSASNASRTSMSRV